MLSFDLVIPIHLSQCQDKLANTIDYDKLCQDVTEFVACQSFQLLETVASQVADMLQTTYAIEHLTLTVTKAHAVKNAGGIRIKLER